MTLGLCGSSVHNFGVIYACWVAHDSGTAVLALVAACGSFSWPLVATVVKRASCAASMSRGSCKGGVDDFGCCLCLSGCSRRSDKWEVVVSGFFSDSYGMKQQHTPAYLLLLGRHKPDMYTSLSSMAQALQGPVCLALYTSLYYMNWRMHRLTCYQN